MLFLHRSSTHVALDRKFLEIRPDDLRERNAIVAIRDGGI
jgi:hypothetical protein